MPPLLEPGWVACINHGNPRDILTTKITRFEVPICRLTHHIPYVFLAELVISHTGELLSQSTGLYQSVLCVELRAFSLFSLHPMESHITLSGHLVLLCAPAWGECNASASSTSFHEPSFYCYSRSSQATLRTRMQIRQRTP